MRKNILNNSHHTYYLNVTINKKKNIKMMRIFFGYPSVLSYHITSFGNALSTKKCVLLVKQKC